jgi:Zn finger protein HypA/HybF involved in hydrogenase expression
MQISIENEIRMSDLADALRAHDMALVTRNGRMHIKRDPGASKRCRECCNTAVVLTKDTQLCPRCAAAKRNAQADYVLKYHRSDLNWLGRPEGA